MQHACAENNNDCRLMKPTRDWLERLALQEEGFFASDAPGMDSPVVKQAQAQRHVFAPYPCDDLSFGQIRVAQPYVLETTSGQSRFRVVWIQRNRARDVVIHCETPGNAGAFACNCAEEVREHMSELGVPRDALWFEASSRTAQREDLLQMLGRNYILMPVEFHGRRASWGSSTTFEAMGKRLGLDPARLEQLCQL
jgi:hypothetical protein